MNKVKKPSIADMSDSDRLETYEMLRASHTLLRMAYGCIALFSGIDNKDAAAEFNSHFDYVFKRIASTAESFASVESGDKFSN